MSVGNLVMQFLLDDPHLIIFRKDPGILKNLTRDEATDASRRYTLYTGEVKDFSFSAFS
jgi:hypothetical protein